MLKRLSVLLLIGFLVLILSIPISASKNVSPQNIPDPIPIKPSEPLHTITGKASNGNTETPGEWYIGTTPSNLDPNAPILLFVPGLNNIAQVFWDDNNMYQTAVDAGYQTAFVQLHDAGGASADMWDNGALLADKIAEISNHFGGKPITVIAYSKGGVDTQTALTYYGAWQYVDNVITLSSPHHGSQLADLAYSSGAGWLADLLGATGDGTYAMQTGFMDDFRTQIDGQSRAYYNDYYTIGGTDWGSAFSSTWYGGVYLSQYGSNDGVVTATSSRLPGGQLISIGDWNHTTVRTGETFPVFDDYLSDSTLSSASILTTNDSVEKNSPAFNQWIEGGPLSAAKENQIAITVEDNVKDLSLNLMTTDSLSDVRLISPSGDIERPALQSTKIEEGIFIGAISNVIHLTNPEAGEWKLELTTKADDAYLLVTTYQAPGKINFSEKSTSPNTEQLTYHLHANTAEVQEKTLKATYQITQSSNPENSKTITISGTENLSKTLPLMEKNQVYNITIDIEGLTQNGKPFKRTIVDSVFVDDN
ncbi:esterase/lipase family protein [Ornithinibacillus xuwenensis]|uniref:Triacylglycerol lipase n=1 Tax=Ornithinibacillus xuwenensis TaxID=3144668 RepID=A0ABU9XJV2_9BACI